MCSPCCAAQFFLDYGHSVKRKETPIGYLRRLDQTSIIVIRNLRNGRDLPTLCAQWPSKMHYWQTGPVVVKLVVQIPVSLSLVRLCYFPGTGPGTWDLGHMMG